MADEEATVVMVDSNIQREELLYSEKAYAYKMKLDAIDRVKGRPKKEGQVVPDYLGKKSTEMVAEGSGESYKQIERYIRLTCLIKPMPDYVDEKRIAFGAGVELSYLEPEGQEQLYQIIQRLCVFPNLSQAKKLKELSREGKLDENGMEIILSDEKPAAQTVRLQRKKLNEYFPADYSAEQYSFYRIPKMLFTAECFRSLSCEAKVLYGLMLDRMGLALKTDGLMKRTGFTLSLRWKRQRN